MSAKHPGPPAFPRPASVAPRSADIQPQDGMTLRDYFAAAALTRVPQYDTATMASWAYDLADAMLKERSK
jgi:hypothetical protein